MHTLVGVYYHSNDRFCMTANLICFFECLSCSFILKDSKGGTITRHIGHVKVYTIRTTNMFKNILKVNSFPLSHSLIRILDGPFFHCCFLLLVYMLHILDGGPTLEIGSMDLHIEERSDLLDAPSSLHSCHDIEYWYSNTSIFGDCAHTCHARWTYHTHDKFASYAWIDSHYDCLVASCITMSSMIYELVHFLSKFVVIYLDGIFIHHDRIAHHQLHDHILILSTHYHVHAFYKPSHMTSFCTMVALITFTIHLCAQ